MAEMGFTRGRIDQTYQGSVSIYMNHPLIRNLVLTTNPMFFFFKKKKQVMKRESILLIHPMFVKSIFLFFLDLISLPWGDAMI